MLTGPSASMRYAKLKACVSDRAKRRREGYVCSYLTEGDGTYANYPKCWHAPFNAVLSIADVSKVTHIV